MAKSTIEIPNSIDIGACIHIARQNPRYGLRLTSLQAIAIGSVINLICFVVAVVTRRYNGPVHITIWSGIVYPISFIYQVTDLLVKNPASDGLLSKPYFRGAYLLSIDGLGFLAFLALLIANGIIISDMYYGSPQVYVYNSVPWMFCCAVHLRVALEGLLRVVRDVIHRRDRRHGAKCRSTAVEKSEGKYVDDTDREQYSPLIAGANNTMDPEADGV